MNNLYNFLEKNEKLKLQILTFLEADSNQYFPMATLMEELGLSRFKLVNYVNDINVDLGELAAAGKVKLEIVNSNFLTAVDLTDSIIANLRITYIERSNRFLYFQELMYQNISIYDFSEKQFVSESKAYVIQQDLLKIIKPYKLTIKNGQLIGEETDIRITYFMLYYFFFNGIKYPFSETEIVEAMYRAICEAFSLELPPTQEVKLRFFIAITCLRIAEGNYILGEPNHQAASESQEEIIYAIASTFFKEDESLLRVESQYLLAFLIAENYITIDKSYYAKLENKVTERLSQQFITLFCEKITGDFSIDSKQLEENLLLLEDEISRIHFKLLHFNLYPDVFATRGQIKYFQEVYPEYFEVIEAFLNSYIDKTNIIVDRAALFYDYMFAIVTTFPIQLLQRKIHICIDFSRGTTYSNYIAHNIFQFQPMNIILDMVPSANTDLYISDFELAEINCEQLIWKEPPMIRDWKNLGNLLVKIRERKSNEK